MHVVFDFPVSPDPKPSTLRNIHFYQRS